MKRLTRFQLCMITISFILASTIPAVTQTDLVGLTINSSGNVGIGTSTPTAGLEINKGNTNDVALKLTSSGPGWGSGMRFNNRAAVREYGIYVGSDGTWNFSDEKAHLTRLYIDTSGDTHVTGNLFAKNFPSGDHGNALIDINTGQFYVDSSSRRYKQNIRHLEDDYNKLLKAAPQTYTRPDSPETWEIGYIAEDFERLGLTRLLRYDRDKRPHSINYTKMSLYLVEILKKHEGQIRDYEQKTDRLEKEVGQLRRMVEELTAKRTRN